MRILIHMGDPYTMENPCGKRMKTFCEVFQRCGHQVVVLAPLHDVSLTGIGEVRDCFAVRLKRKTILNRLANGMMLAISTFVNSLRVGRIDAVITSSPPPLISLSGWLIAKVKRAKLVYDVRDIWPDVAWEMGSFSSDTLYSRVFEFIRNFMLRHSDLVTTVSPGKVQKLKSYAPEAKVINITNGLDEAFLENREDSEILERYELGKRFTCVYCGNLGLAQGLMQLLHIAKRARKKGLPVQFLLFGSGIEETELKRYASENGLENVCFAGRVANEKMYTIFKYANMSFVSLVNKNLKDSIPTKIFEALGVGCPVLLAASGDAVELLNECGLGIAVSPNDEEALWRAFLCMYENQTDILKNRRRAKEIIMKKYSRQAAAHVLEGQLVGVVGDV